MTEYDYSPEAMEQYRNTQDRIQQWVGGSHDYPDRYGPSMSRGGGAYHSGHMGGYDRDYDPNYGSSSRRHGRSRSRYQDRHRGRSRERVHRGEEYPPHHGMHPNSNMHGPMPGPLGPHPGGLDPNIHPPGTMPGSFPGGMPMGMGSRAGSVAPSISRQPSGILNPGQPIAMSHQGSVHHHEDELPPLPVHTSPSLQQHGGPNIGPSHIPFPEGSTRAPSIHGSHRGFPRGGVDHGRNFQVPMSMSSSGINERDGGRHSRRHSRSRSRSRSRRHPSRSYSGDSYASYSSYSSDSLNHPHHPHSPSRHQQWRHGQIQDQGHYQMVHPSPHSPTVINPSSAVPILIPINGGNGGYVVVPPVGQEVRVVDPGKYYKTHYLGDNPSLIERILSPSTWNIGRRRDQKYKIYHA